MENNNEFQSNHQQNQPQDHQTAQYSAPANGAPAQYNISQPKAKKPIYKKWWFWLIIVVVVLIVIGGISGGSSDSGTSGSGSETQTVTDSQSQTDSGNETDIPSVIDAGTSITVDGLEISYISCSTDYTDYNEYLAPASGNKVIRAEFDIENISDSDYSIDGIECYADNAKCDTYIWADDYANPVFESVSPGRTLKAVIYYEVPQGAQNIEIEMETNLWAEEKVIFNVK